MQRKLVITIPALVLAVVLAIIGMSLATNRQQSQTAPAGKLKIEGFNSEGVCAAIMPACGYCPGEETSGNCYVTQAEFDEYKQQYSDLKATR